MKRRFRQSVALAGGALALAASSGSASAGGKPPHPGTSAAVEQYVESFPTSSGPQATGVGKVRTKRLAPKLQKRLVKEAGGDAQLLQAVATSSAYGAPQQKLRTTGLKGSIGGRALGLGKRAGKSGAGKDPLGGDANPTQALSAAANVVSDGSDGRLIGLAVFLAAITALAVGAAAVRQRTARAPDR